MHRYQHRLPALALSAIALVVGCSSNNPTYSPGPPGPGGPTPTPSGATPSPTPSGATPTPTPAPTVTPTPTSTPTAVPTGVPTGALTCTGAGTNSIPGIYTTILTEGNVSAGAYAQTAGFGFWLTDNYVAPTPTPVPTATPTPIATTTPTPGPTATPVTVILYSGTYSVAGFNGTSTAGTAYTANPTVGCFILDTTQNGSSFSSPPPTLNAVGFGTPNFATTFATSSVATGFITNFTITGLGPSSGTGTFTLDNAATGTATITASQIVTFDKARQLFDRLKHARRRF